MSNYTKQPLVNLHALETYSYQETNNFDIINMTTTCTCLRHVLPEINHHIIHLLEIAKLSAENSLFVDGTVTTQHSTLAKSPPVRIKLSIHFFLLML